MPDSEARSAFPKILKAYMEKNGYNQSDIAKHLHVSKQTVSEWVKGNKFPRVDKMQELADLFGVLMSDMYTPQKAGVVLRVNGSRGKSFRELTVGAMVKSPLADVGAFAKPIMLERSTDRMIKQAGVKDIRIVRVSEDPELSALLKIWKSAPDKAKKSAVEMLKIMSEPDGKE